MQTPPKSSDLALLENMHSAISSRKVMSLSSLARLINLWVTDFDRAGKIISCNKLNRMHLVGMSVCVLLHRCKDLETLPRSDLRSILGTKFEQVVIVGDNIDEYSFEDLQHLLSAVQLEFASFYVLENDGYNTDVDVELLCMRLMARVGYYISHKWRCKSTTATGAVQQHDVMDPDLEALHGLVDVDAEGFSTLRPESLSYFFDGLHSVCACLLYTSPSPRD